MAAFITIARSRYDYLCAVERQMTRAMPDKVRKIIMAVAGKYDVPAECISGQSRSSRVVYARHAVFYLLRKLTKLSLREIAATCGRSDHTTILHAIRSIDRRALFRPVEMERLMELQRALG
jgi:chromosomal replication initiation ATPase DnaA